MTVRPLSPHLQIYRWQLTSVLSILHRLTGIALCFALIGLTGWLFSLSQGPVFYKKYMDILNSWPLQVISGFVIICLNFHFFNGIRHLLWDIGYGLDIEKVYVSGKAVLTLTFLNSLLMFWWY